MKDFDPDLLRTFLAFADGGSLARAAEAVGRTPSAVTAQMQRLEAMVGEPLLGQSGRGRVLTPIGLELVGHARRILAAHREAWLMLKGTTAAGPVSFGCTQDFTETLVPSVLAVFARTHPRVRLDIRVGRSAVLHDAFDAGTLDVILVMSRGTDNDVRLVRREPMLWLARAAGTTSGELALALLDPPCGFRTAALAALDAARRPYRIAATSASLAGLRAVVRGGLAVTPRTARMREADLVDVGPALDLPALPDAEFALRARADGRSAVDHLTGLIADELATGV